MEFPDRIFWRPVSQARGDLIPVLVWDGYRFWLATPDEDGTFKEYETGEDIEGVIAWADIPTPPQIAPPPPAGDYYG
jgi:hypothetical protein